MRISDWSSDVCSSDLLGGRTFGAGEAAGQDDVGDSHDVLSGLHPLTSAAAAARPHCQAVRAGPAPRPAAGGAAAAATTRRRCPATAWPCPAGGRAATAEIGRAHV